MKFRCPVKVTCPDDTDPPTQNLSAERPDQEHFFTFGSQDPWQPPSIDHRPPPVDPPVFDWCVLTQEQAAAIGIPLDIYEQMCIDNKRHPQPHGNTYFSNPQTVSVPCGDGGTFTYTLPAGQSQSIWNQQNADNIAKAFALEIANRKKCCPSNLSALSGCQDQPYSATITMTGGTPPYRYDIIAGSVPPGTFPKTKPDGNFLLSGTPYAAGNYTFALMVTDAVGSTVTRAYTIVILRVANPPAATQNQAYSSTLVTVGGDAPYTFALISGTLPTGLSLGTAGTISGTPTAAGASSFTVKVTDLNGFSCNMQLLMTVNPAVNWNLLQWTITQNLQIAGGTNTFSPLNGAFGSVWHDLSNAPAQPPDGARCQSHGDLFYTGPGASFNVHVVVAYTPDAGLGNTSFGELEVTINGVSQGIKNYQAPHPPNNGPGTYDYPYTIPAGVNVPVQIRTDQATGAIAGNPGSFEMTVTIT